MFGQIASHTSNRPYLQDTSDISLGHLPSDLKRPDGSCLGRNFSCSKSSVDYVIHGHMSMVTSLAVLTAKAMGAQIIHLCTTMVTRVGCTDGSAQPELDCNPQKCREMYVGMAMLRTTETIGVGMAVCRQRLHK